MEIKPETAKKRIGYPVLVTAALALASCQTEPAQPLGGAPLPPPAPKTQQKPTPEPKKTKPRTPSAPKVDLPREPQRTMGKCPSPTYYRHREEARKAEGKKPPLP